jgi:excinuclease ABC subunit B
LQQPHIQGRFPLDGQAAAELHFELAARLRDEIRELKRELRQMTEATR